MSEIKIFVDVSERTTNKVVICQENADKLGIKNGSSIEVENPDNNKKTSAVIEISNMVLDFAGQVSRNLIDTLEFTGVEYRFSNSKITSSESSYNANSIPWPILSYNITLETYCFYSNTSNSATNFCTNTSKTSRT
jgi:hypothetical protein